MGVMSVQANRSACLTELRRQIGIIEHGRFRTGTIDEAGPAEGEHTAFDPARIDPFLVGGGGEPALQELVADGYGSQPSVRDFGLALVASLLHRQTESRGPMEGRSMVLWCQRQRDAFEFGQLYGPGLRHLGLPPDRLLMVTGRRDADCLWAMEQGLASKGLLVVVGMVDRADLTASRRLSLAARAHGTWCLLLPLQHGRDPSAARTRWRVRSASSIPDDLDPKGLGLPSWQLTLERSQNGRTDHWTVEWDHAAHHFHLAAPMGVATGTARRGGPDRPSSKVISFDRTG